MRILSQIAISRKGLPDATIQLLQGDLSAIPPEHAVDILIISAYPGSYVPVPRTLIAALNEKGLSVEELARHKAIDLREQLNCWLSEPLSAAQQQQFNVKEILCFEPYTQSAQQEEVVGNMFRCINNFAFNSKINTIAMPVLASGKQRVPFEKMLPALLDASIFWLENGLPLDGIKLVVYSDEQSAIALPVFNRAAGQNAIKQSVKAGEITASDALKELEKNKACNLPGEAQMEIVASEIMQMTGQLQQPSPEAGGQPVATGRKDFVPESPGQVSAPTQAVPASAPQQYDYFISYAHTHGPLIKTFVDYLQQRNANLEVFYDRSTIPPGGLWIKQISDAIQKAKKILVFLSPDYSNSPVCWDEFQCAKLMEYNSRKPMIQTVYLYNDATMPPIMGIYSWADCREGDLQKLKDIAAMFGGKK